MSNAALIRSCYRAYETKDRALVESTIGEPFSFSSPRDDRLDRATYFERCWANADKMKSIVIENLVEDGDEAFIRYRGELTDGKIFRNTEYMRIEGGKIAVVEVYFGRTLTEGD